MKAIDIVTSYGVITVDFADPGGSITLPTSLGDPRQDPALEAIASLILAHACEGINVGNDKYTLGINVALDAIANRY